MAILSPVICLYGQSQHPLIEYTTENGLSLNSVNDLHFDKQGFLWVTTADGLQRFDGYRFQTFKHDPADSNSIPENSVSLLYEDQQNNLWITHRTGLCFKPKGKNEFIDLSSSLHSEFSKYPLYCVYETDTSVWVLNYPNALFSINKTSLFVKKEFLLPESIKNDALSIITRRRSNDDPLWLRVGATSTKILFRFTNSGLEKFDNTKKAILHFFIPLGKDSVVIASEKLLYKAMAKDPFTPVKILNDDLNTSDFGDDYLPISGQIANGQYLLRGIKNMWVYDRNKETVEIFPFDKYFSNDLIRYYNTSTTDRHQNSWLGYNGIGGIKVISLQKFKLFNRPERNRLTYTLAADNMGKIFAGIYLGDIEVYNNDGEFLQSFVLPEKHKSFGSPRAMAMMDSVTLIVKSTLQELYAIDTRTGKVNVISNILPRTDSIYRVFELGIQKINDGEVWISVNNSIISITKNKNGFISKTICTLPEKENITSFIFNADKHLWVGTIAAVWLVEQNTIKKIPLPYTHVKHINQHPDGDIWMATTNGLSILNKKGHIKNLNTKDGLPNSFIYSVLFDESGNAWVSTNRGLAKVSYASATNDSSFIVTSYSAREGLQGDEFNTKGYCKESDGTLYFAGVNGINFFKPQDLVSKSGPSPTMLTKIDVNNLSYLPNLQPEFINTISLPHKQNNISLSFSCIDFTVPEKNQYKFWLKGFQDDWSLPQTNNTVQYILPVGEYELHVLGANYEGIWSKEPLILKINILPPWYQTNWAKAIFALLILAAVAAIFYFISRSRYQKKLRQLQMAQEVQKEKQRLSRDLHDNLGSQITWLSNNITQLERAEEEKRPVEKKLSQLKEGTGELMQTLRETIWILNKDKISCVELFDKVVSLAARHIEVCPPMQLHTEENIASNIELNSGQALQIFRICQEAINNTCKHAKAKTLTIKADTVNNHFTVSVIDDGKGFDLNKENPGHYGLQNMKDRAVEANILLNITSSPDKGTSVLLSVRN